MNSPRPHSPLPATPARGGLARCPCLLLVALAAALCGAAVLLAPRAAPPDTAPAAPTDAEIATRLDLTLHQVSRLHRERGLSNESLAALPPDKLARALHRLDEPRPDSPGEAAEFRALQAKDEKGNLPEVAQVVKAFEDLRTLRAAAPPAPTVAGIPVGPLASAQAATAAGNPELLVPLTAGITPGGWTWMGPGNIGGRTRAIVIDPLAPTTMYAGSVGGGIWKTNDGGGSWAPLDDFMGNLAVATLIMDPTNNKTLYAGTGEGFWNGDALRGAGIFKTTNAGVNWNSLPSTATSDFHYVNRLAISSDGKILLAATRTGVFRSTDEGNTWSAVGAPLTIETLDVRCHGTDPKRCVAGARNGKAFFSVNGGGTWKAAAGLPAVPGFEGRVELAFARANPKVVYASVDNDSGEVYRSLDGGETYKLRNTGTNYLGSQGWYDNTIWAGDPANVNLVVVGGLDLYRSDNGGTSFTQISQWFLAPASAHADHHTIVAHPKYNGTTNRTVYFGNDGGIYVAKNVATVTSSLGWRELNNNYGVTQFYGAGGHVGTGRVVGGTQDNGTIRFTPAGGTEAWTTMFGGDGGFSAWDPSDVNFCYGEYVRLQIHRSTDGGVSSSFIHAGIADAGTNANFIAPFILDPNDPNTMLAGGASLWRSKNVKASTPAWANIKSSVGSPISAIAVAKGNANVIWVGHNNGDVYKTANGTSASPTWTRVDNGATPLPNRYCHRLTIEPGNHDVVYATFGGYFTGNIWKTVNAGTAWNNIGASLPGAPVRSLVVHPTSSKFLYAGTEVGIFASEDGGGFWSPTNEGPTNCSVDELFFMGTRLLAVTHGRGLFRINLAAPVAPPVAGANPVP